MFALVALSGCVDKTPPPLWPTPPPPTLAVPIGVHGAGVRIQEAGAGAGGGAGVSAASASPPASSDAGSPGELGPWRPEPGWR